jgi:hypothetical protein
MVFCEIVDPDRMRKKANWRPQRQGRKNSCEAPSGVFIEKTAFRVFFHLLKHPKRDYKSKRSFRSWFPNGFSPGYVYESDYGFVALSHGLSASQDPDCLATYSKGHNYFFRGTSVAVSSYEEGRKLVGINQKYGSNGSFLVFVHIFEWLDTTYFSAISEIGSRSTNPLISSGASMYLSPKR